jgi:2,4-dienoyl-CoA reductase-like NADH-dependent reductase (Old Yellow Enzyme family)
MSASSLSLPVQAASTIPFSDGYPQPQAMTLEKIEEFKKAFSDAVDRCNEIGFDFIEIHGAHVSPDAVV